MASLIKRGDTYQMQWYENGRKRRRSLRTSSFQLAKERIRQFESAQFRGEEALLPTRTLLAELVSAYVTYIRTKKTAKSECRHGAAATSI